MNKVEFLKRLEELLMDLPEEERRSAIEYYYDYIEDAGPENEGQVLKKLESPEAVAATIRKVFVGSADEDGFTESGYEEFQPKDAPVEWEAPKREESSYDGTYKGDYGDFGKDSYTDTGRKPYQEPVYGRRGSGRPGILTALMMVGTVILILIMIGLLIGFGVGGIGLVLVGLGVGIFSFGGGAAFGIAAVGLGFILLAIFLLVLIGLIAYCRNVIPVILYGRE